MFLCILISALLAHSVMAEDSTKEGVGVVEQVPLNSARILASKFSLSQYAVENMDYVIEYNLYNVGDRTALKVTLDDRNSFPTQSFEIVKGLLQVRWEKIAPGENVTHSVVVQPRSYGTFNYTAAMVTYYPTNDAKQVVVGYSTAPGEGHIYRLKDYERRFSSKVGIWILFFLMILPTTAGPFFIWYNFQKKYAKAQQQPKKTQ